MSRGASRHSALVRYVRGSRSPEGRIRPWRLIEQGHEAVAVAIRQGRLSCLLFGQTPESRPADGRKRIASAVTHSRLTGVKDMAAYFADKNPDPDKLRAMFGPGQVDQAIRQAIQMCWLMLPKSKKNVDELERQIRRLMERAIKDLRKDIAAFGLSD
jgi:hypothetical protein